jgi:hypothetical protein
MVDHDILGLLFFVYHGLYFDACQYAIDRINSVALEDQLEKKVSVLEH